MKTLTIKRLTKIYQRKSFFGKVSSSVDALINVDMQLEEGRFYGIVGESGSGKSTLARLLVGLEKPNYGWILLNGKDLHTKGEKKKETLGHLQMVFQNPYLSLNPRFSIQDILLEGLWNRGTASEQAARKIRLMMRQSGLPLTMLTKYPHQISGGERQRVAIIRALLLNPSVLILDEPTSSLDVSVRGQVLELIQKLVQGRSMFIIMISHDLSVVRKIADYIFVMRKGTIVEEGDAEQVCCSPEHNYTKELLWSASYFDFPAQKKGDDHHPGECCP